MLIHVVKPGEALWQIASFYRVGHENNKCQWIAKSESVTGRPVIGNTNGRPPEGSFGLLNKSAMLAIESDALAIEWIIFIP